MKKYYILLIFVFSVSSLLAQNPNLGTSGAQFLKIHLGAKEEAMGGGVIGLVDDASAVFWNPAGIAKVKNVDVNFSYTNWFNLFDLNAASVAYNLGEAGVVDASMIVFSTGQMEITTEQEPNGTGRYFDAQDLALGISYARFLTDRFNVGVTVKYVYQRIWNEAADGFAFDVGTQYRLDFQNLTIAMSMANFGGDLKFGGPDLNITYDKNANFPLSRLAPAQLQTDSYPLPLYFQVGIGFDIYQADFIKVRGDVDAIHPNDNSERINLGTEFSFFDRFYLRGGYKYNYDDEKFAFGAGVNLPISQTLIRFDYAYSIYDILPSVHRVSLGMSF